MTNMAGFRVIAGPDAGQVFYFQDRLTFGRSNSTRMDDTSFVLLSDPRVSREHLTVFREGDNFFALDKYSSNGSYIEGQRIPPNKVTPLQDQAEVKLGTTILLFDSETQKQSNPELGPITEAGNEQASGDMSPSVIIDAKEWLEQLQAQGPHASAQNLSRQLQAITQVSLALGGTTDLSHLTEQITRCLFDVFQNAENVFLFAYEKKSGKLTALGGSNEDAQLRQRVSKTIINQVIKEQNAILLYDAMSDKSYQNHESIYALQLRSVICAPLLFKNQILGLVQVDSRSDANRFSEEDLKILTGISAQIAVALKNTELFHDIENLLEGFVSAAVQVIEARDPVTAGHSFRVAYYTESLAVAVDKHDTGPLKQASLRGQQIRELRYASLLHDFGKVGIKEDILTKENKLFDHEIDNIQLRFEYAKACMERHLYYRVLKSHETKSLTKQDLQEHLSLLQAQIQKSHALLDNYFDKITRHNKPNLTYTDLSDMLRDIYQETFEDLNNAERRLLTEFEFSALQIPKGSLTTEERREIELHVTHTYNFLNLIPWTDDLREIPTIAHAHHEKLDGSGYPNRLKADHIPLQSRIMTIADIYDALTAGDRPYKSSVNPDIALGMLEQEAKEGKLDAELVNVFIQAKAYLNQ